MVEDGAYRLDLLYRLQVVEIHLAPLRSRVEDIGALASHFLAKFSAENGRSLSTISQDAMRRLEAYGWPGNVRELSNAIERATVLAAKEETVLDVSHLPSALRQAA
jgi:transcriptional regulator with PAS, ATPase and Fis domain